MCWLCDSDIVPQWSNFFTNFLYFSLETPYVMCCYIFYSLYIVSTLSFATYWPLLCLTTICCWGQGSQVLVCSHIALVTMTRTLFEKTGIDFRVSSFSPVLIIWFLFWVDWILISHLYWLLMDNLDVFLVFLILDGCLWKQEHWMHILWVNVGFQPESAAYVFSVPYKRSLSFQYEFTLNMSSVVTVFIFSKFNLQVDIILCSLGSSSFTNVNSCSESMPYFLWSLLSLVIIDCKLIGGYCFC